MQPSLRMLLDRVLDYAGMFPPAKLPLEDAIRNYARHRGESEAWMLSRFICPVGRLAELGPFCEELFTEYEPCRLSVIGSEHPLTPEFIKDVRHIDHFAKTYGQRARVEAIEVRIPEETIVDWNREAVAEGLNVLASKLLEHHFSSVEVFLEPIFAGDWKKTVRRVVGALQQHDVEHGTPDPERIGFKLRTGGAAADAFPTVEQVAFAIDTCRDANIPLKFTAGLHHPLHHYSVEIGADVQGFLNVFAAGVIAQARGVDEATLCDVLREREAGAFQFGAQGFRWRELDMTNEEIETARRELTLSFGSCSFDEPLADLRKLDLL